MRRHARSPSKRTPCSTLAFLIPICEPKTGNLLIKAPGVPIGNSGVSHARILSYPLRAAAPRRYLRFVRLSEHDPLGITALRLLESCGSRSASTLPSTPRNADSPFSHLSVRRYTYPYAIFNGLSGKAVAKRPRARFSCCTMTTNLGETFRLALAALRSTVGDAKFREIEKTWV